MLGMTDEILESDDGNADDLVTFALQISMAQIQSCENLLAEYDVEVRRQKEDDEEEEEEEEEEEKEEAEEEEEEEDGNSSISTITNETTTRNIKIDVDAEKNIGGESEMVDGLYSKKRKGNQTNQKNDTKEYKKTKT
jgi:CO dehydrogenase/acetyl-CoA synthase beta subunit